MAHTPVTFIKKGYISYTIPIPVGINEKERAANWLVIQENGHRLISFRHDASSGLADPRCTFTTESPILKRFLLEWNEKNGNKLKVDVSASPLKCMFCDFETPDGGEESQQRLAAHVLLEHQDNDVDEEDVLISVDADGKLEDPDSHKLADLKAIAIEAGADEGEVGSITSKQGVVDYLRENIPTAVSQED